MPEEHQQRRLHHSDSSHVEGKPTPCGGPEHLGDVSLVESEDGSSREQGVEPTSAISENDGPEDYGVEGVEREDEDPARELGEREYLGARYDLREED